MEQDIPGAPPALTADTPSIADRIRANLTKNRLNQTQELLFPNSENLYITFRALNDWGEFRDVVNQGNLSRLPETAQEVQAGINTLVAASVGSFALIDGERHDLGFPLGAQLFNYLYPDATVRPETDGQAVSLMFDGDTLGLVMFARRLNVWRTIQGTDGDSGKS